MEYLAYRKRMIALGITPKSYVTWMESNGQ